MRELSGFGQEREMQIRRVRNAPMSALTGSSLEDLCHLTRRYLSKQRCGNRNFAQVVSVTAPRTPRAARVTLQRPTCSMARHVVEGYRQMHIIAGGLPKKEALPYRP
jgi:hypothetical protein